MEKITEIDELLKKTKKALSTLYSIIVKRRKIEINDCITLEMSATIERMFF